MAIKHVVFDWNGTLCDMEDDSLIMRGIAKAVLTQHFKVVASGHLSRIANIARFIRGLAAFNRTKRNFDAGKIGLAGLYAPFNDNMLDGADVDLVDRMATAYGREHCHQIDRRLLVPAIAARDAGATLTIFSAALDRSLLGILRAANVDIDDIVSNTLEQQAGRAIGITARYRDDKVGDFRREFIEKRGWLPVETVYAGDAEVDEPIARLLPKGHFIVPFLADPGFSNRMRTTYGATAPETPDDLAFLLAQA